MESSIRPRRLAIRNAAAIALGVLAFPAAALAGGSFTVKAHFPNHTPIANKKWPITIDVTKGKTQLSGSVKYQFLLGPTVVSTQPGHKFTKGVYTDKLTFPSDAIGQALTLGVVVTTKYGSKTIDWTVDTKK
jgi:hypothetical protein